MVVTLLLLFIFAIDRSDRCEPGTQATLCRAERGADCQLEELVIARAGSTQRRNLFNQTDITFGLNTAFVRHTILIGAEVGRQRTANLRQTAFFNDSTASLNVPYTNGVIGTPVAWRPNATDANNHLRARVAATYMQDQMELSRYLQFVVGFRFDNFDLRYFNNRAPENFRRTDAA